jgi:hypothetical protein
VEEDQILTGFHQQVQKARDKSWNDRQIKKKAFKEGDLVFLYDNKSFQHPRKLRMHWLGPYEVKYVTYGGDVWLIYLVGIYLRGIINEIRLKLYKDNRPPTVQLKKKKKQRTKRGNKTKNPEAR